MSQVRVGKSPVESLVGRHGQEKDLDEKGRKARPSSLFLLIHLLDLLRSPSNDLQTKSHITIFASISYGEEFIRQPRLTRKKRPTRACQTIVNNFPLGAHNSLARQFRWVGGFSPVVKTVK
ncbi:MAG: hypothetical protein Q9163_002418 [Psora crenata]